MSAVSHSYTVSDEGLHLCWALRSVHVYGVVLHVDLVLTVVADGVLTVVLSPYTYRRKVGCVHRTEDQQVCWYVRENIRYIV